jgi:hypothetical protein
MPRRSAKDGGQQPGVGDHVVVVEGDGEPVGLWEDGIEKGPSTSNQHPT